MRRLLSFATRGIMGQVLALAFVLLLFGIGTRGFFLSPKNLSAILSLAGFPLIICLGIVAWLPDPQPFERPGLRLSGPSRQGSCWRRRGGATRCWAP